MIVERLISKGYPDTLLNYSYDSSFVVRGLLYDRQYGNLLKIDGFGNILVAWHGFKPLNFDVLRKYYPNKFVNKEDGARYYIYNTLFNLPEIYVMAALIDMYEGLDGYETLVKGIKLGWKMQITTSDVF